MLSLSSGAGAGLISQGRIIRGYNGMAGEIGHMVLEEQPSGGFTFRSMIWESAIGSGALLRAHEERTGRRLDLAGLTAAVEAREADALALIRRWAHWVSRGLLTLIYAHDPERIVVGGELAALFEIMRPEIDGEIRANLASGFAMPSLMTSTLGPDIAAIGAAALVHSDFLRNDYPLEPI
jgi:predicted NBD/HSP70 family sugar kinase